MKCVFEKEVAEGRGVMTKLEASKCLVELFSNYVSICGKYYCSVPQKYSEAVAMAVMLLGRKEQDEN